MNSNSGWTESFYKWVGTEKTTPLFSEGTPESKQATDYRGNVGAKHKTVDFRLGHPKCYKQ